MNILHRIFGVVSITVLQAAHSRGKAHTGCAKLRTMHSLTYVNSNNVSIDIGTRYPIYIKPDERISYTGFSPQEFYKDLDLVEPQIKHNLYDADIRDFELIYDVLDEQVSTDVIFKIPEEAIVESSDFYSNDLLICENESLEILPCADKCVVFSMPSICINPKISSTKVLSQSIEISTNCIEAVSPDLSPYWLCLVGINRRPARSVQKF